MQDGPLEPLDHPVGPRMARFGAPMREAERQAPDIKRRFEFLPVVGQHGAQRPPRLLVGREDALPEKRQHGGRGHFSGDAVLARRLSAPARHRSLASSRWPACREREAARTAVGLSPVGPP